MKSTISWHKINLHNQKDYIKRLNEEILEKKEKIIYLENEAEFYETQIRAAEKKKKSEFDRDRFMAKKKKVH